MAQPVIDIHAHILEPETIRLLQNEIGAAAPKLTPIDDESSLIEVAGRAFKPFPRGAWDLERRLADMESCGFDRQVVSVCPQTFLYDQEPEVTLAVSRIQNEQIAALAASSDRFLGLATAPMQAPELAAEELRRAMRLTGMVGPVIGANANGRNLDDPELEPFWAAAAETGAFILVHPMNAAGVPGVGAYYLKNIVGNPLDTTIAAACLVFGGVLERHPALKVCLAHGGGFVPYQAGRFVHGWEVRQEPKANLKGSPQDSLDRLLYDTILHAPEPLEFLVRNAGAERVMLGSDYPFDMGQYDAVGVIRSLAVSDAEKATVLGGAALALLGQAERTPARAAS
ncbi:MAG TPA: amidohydrolase family protein [Afifellaceae bacterium]|nr:amidohydrolase family protein [Afifellaceae bacterium]